MLQEDGTDSKSKSANPVNGILIIMYYRKIWCQCYSWHFNCCMQSWVRVYLKFSYESMADYLFSPWLDLQAWLEVKEWPEGQILKSDLQAK